MELLLLIPALALSVDGFAVGAAFGLRGVVIGPGAKGAIALLSAGFAALAVSGGNALSNLLPAKIGQLAGGMLLVLLGGLGVLRTLMPRAKTDQRKQAVWHKFRLLGLTILVIREPSEGDLDHSGRIDLQEAILLGLSLSIDMLGAGVGLALAGINSLWLAPLVGLVQTCCLGLGESVGRQLKRLPLDQRIFGVLAGLVLASMGLLRLLG